MDNVIITLMFERSYDPIDLEVPVRLPIDELEVKMLDTLKAMDIERFERTQKVNFKYKNTVLEPDKTFEEYGIWDGSYVTLLEIGG